MYGKQLDLLIWVGLPIGEIDIGYFNAFTYFSCYVPGSDMQGDIIVNRDRIKTQNNVAIFQRYDTDESIVQINVESMLL